MKTFLLIDANSLIHRAYHALPPLTSPSGAPTGAVYGFTSMLLRALKDLRPDYVAAAFDLKGPTFRHEAYKEYKATRPPVPEALGAQLEKSKEVLEALRIKALGIPGFEADDIIGTLAAAAKKNPDLEVIVLSGDLDTLQLADERVKISIPKKGISDMTAYDRRAVEGRYGFPPERLVDYKALRGDPSDNIPGVRGIGEKTARALIAQFGTIENLYRELERGNAEPPLTDAVRKKLAAGKDQALLSKSLAAINTAAPVDTDVSAYAFDDAPKPDAEKLFEELGFKTLLVRMKGG
jgi:DNA polymerase-1